jgi:ribbon-helix-helix protein, copG family
MDNKRNWGGARKGAGVPVTVKPNNKRKQRAISLSDAEYKELKRIADRNGISISQLIREAFDL